MNKIMKKISTIVMLSLIVGSCFALKRSTRTRGRFPYLQFRSSAAYPSASSDRVRALAWHPTDQTFVLGGGPRVDVSVPAGLSQVLLYDVHGDSGGAYIDASAGAITITSTYQANALTWNSDGSYLAVGGSGDTTNQFHLYSYVVQTRTAGPSIGVSERFVEILSLTWGSDTVSSSINSVAWHPEGKLIALGGKGQTDGYHVVVYYLDLITPAMTPVAHLNLGSSAVVNALCWRQDGKFLAVGCQNESTGKAALQNYELIFANSSTGYSLKLASSADFGGSTAYVSALAWSPDRTLLVAGGYSGGDVDDYEVKMYDTYGGNLTNVSGGNVDFGPTKSGARVTSFAWDPLQQYLMVGGYQVTPELANPHQFNLYAFDGATLTPKIGSQNTFGTDTASYVTALAWDLGRKYIVVGGYLPVNSNELWLMEFMTSN